MSGTLACRPPRHFFMRRAGVSIYRCYRHGNPRDVFMSCWFRTADAPNAECHATDFDVRCLPADICERHGIPRTRAGLPPDIGCVIGAIKDAIDCGVITAAGGPSTIPEEAAGAPLDGREHRAVPYA